MNFDHLNSDDDTQFERQLLEMELRPPPAEWRALLLPKPIPPWFPGALVKPLAACWILIGILYLATPETENPDPPTSIMIPQSIPPEILLGYNSQ